MDACLAKGGTEKSISEISSTKWRPEKAGLNIDSGSEKADPTDDAGPEKADPNIDSGPEKKLALF